MNGRFACSSSLNLDCLQTKQNASIYSVVQLALTISDVSLINGVILILC